MPALILSEEQVAEIVAGFRDLIGTRNTDGTDVSDWAPDYLLDAMPKPKIVVEYAIKITMPEGIASFEIDDSIHDAIVRVLSDYTDSECDVCVDVIG